MTTFTNSFKIDVPTLSALQYNIDPQPPQDSPWQDLDRLEDAANSETGGSATRYSEHGQWCIIVFGPHDARERFNTNDGYTLTKRQSLSVDQTDTLYHEAISSVLRDSLESYLTEYEDYWERANSQEFYRSSPDGTAAGYDAYQGYETKIQYNDGFYLTVDPTVKYISKHSVGDYLRKVGDRAAVEKRVINRYCTLMSNDRPSVKLVSLAEDATVSDRTIDNSGTKQSVIEYVENDYKYPDEIVERIHDDEPIARIKFPWSDNPVDSAPSILHPLPEGIEDEMSEYSIKDTEQRWKETTQLLNQIDYLQLLDSQCGVSSTPRKDDYYSFNYPAIQFGEEKIVRLGNENEVEPRQTISPHNWRYIIRDYLDEYGAADGFLGALNIDVLYPEGRRDTAIEAHQLVSEYISTYTGTAVTDSPGGVAHDDYQKLDQWVRSNEERSDGVLVLLDSHSNDYLEIVSELNGLPAQGLQLSTLRGSTSNDEFDDSLFNTALGMAVKTGIRPFLLVDGLSVDVCLGLSVTGDEVNNAAAVLLSGDDGDLLYQTETNLATGSSTVTGKDVVSRVIRQSLSQAINKGRLDQPNSIAIHRNGDFGDGELDGIRDGIETLISDNNLPETVDWYAAEVSKNSPYRLYETDGDAVRTGATMRLDGSNALVTSYGEPHLHQGSPQPLYCTVKDSSGPFDMTDVASDIFDLSFLNWGSPMMKVKLPLSTYLPREMHDILATGTRLPYPPF